MQTNNYATRGQPRPVNYRISDWSLNVGLGLLKRDATSVSLKPAALQILLYLLNRPDQVISRRELGANAIPGQILSEQRVAETISDLRKALSDDPRRPRFIKTHPRRGYSLTASVSQETMAPDIPEIPEKPAQSSPAQTNGSRYRRGPIALGTILIFVLTIALWQFGDKKNDAPAPDYFTDEPVIAVLPMKLIGERATNHVTKGITDELITELSYAPHLVVIDQNTVFNYKPTTKNQHQVTNFDSEYIVQGQAQLLADRLSISLTLQRPDETKMFWKKSFTWPYTEIAAAPKTLKLAVHQAIHPHKQPIPSASPQPVPDTNAYEEFLLGLVKFRSKRQQDLTESIQHFTRAAQQDPDFLRPWVYASLAQLDLALSGFGDTFANGLQSAEENLQVLPPSHSYAEALYVRAFIALFRRQHIQAIEYLHRALNYRPSYAEAYTLLAWIMHFSYKPQAALTNLDRAARIDPRDSLTRLIVKAEIHFIEHQYDEAIHALRTALNMDPQHARAQLLLIATLINTQQLSQAKAMANQFGNQYAHIDTQEIADVFPFTSGLLPAALPAALRQADVIH